MRPGISSSATVMSSPMMGSQLRQRGGGGGAWGDGRSGGGPDFALLLRWRIIRGLLGRRFVSAQGSAVGARTKSSAAVGDPPVGRDLGQAGVLPVALGQDRLLVRPGDAEVGVVP